MDNTQFYEISLSLRDRLGDMALEWIELAKIIHQSSQDQTHQSLLEEDASVPHQSEENA